jgi:hypothetical protein
MVRVARHLQVRGAAGERGSGGITHIKEELMGTQTVPPESATENEQRKQQTTQAEAPQAQSLLDKVVSATEVAKRDAIIVRRAEFDQKQRLAKMFANSGCFQDIDKDEAGKWLPQDISIARAMVKIELGESMGFSAAEAMTGIDIIKGRVAVGAALRGARMQRAGFSWPQMLVTDKGCWIPLCFRGEPMLCPKVDENGGIVTDSSGNPVMTQVVVSYTLKDAQAAGLAAKDNYKKMPSDMYYARAITRAQRRYGPGVLGVDVLDTYEAREVSDAPRRESASISLDSLTISADPNRGHGAEQPETAAEAGSTPQNAPAPAAPQPTAAPAPAQQAAPAPAQQQARDRQTCTNDSLPDPDGLDLGAEAILSEGHKLYLVRVVQDGEARIWKAFGEISAEQVQRAGQQAPPQTPPQTQQRRQSRRNLGALEFGEKC